VKLVASLMVGPGELIRYLDLCMTTLLLCCDEVVARAEENLEADWLAKLPGVTVVRAEAPMFEHEGRARQQLLDATLERDPTHVLTIDADELIGDGAKLREEVERSGAHVFTARMLEVWKAFDECLCVRVDGGWNPHPVTAVWQVPPGAHLRIADKQLASGREPTLVRQLSRRSVQLDSDVFHFGWTNVADRAARMHRYQLTDGGRFHARAHLDSIGWPDDRVEMAWTEWPDDLAALREPILERARRRAKKAALASDVR
jgi:hypothetical protein